VLLAWDGRRNEPLACAGGKAVLIALPLDIYDRFLEGFDSEVENT
jgi:hypothetical protein